MTIYYIDPQAAANGNGLTVDTPMNTLPADYGIGTVSHKYLLKAGSTFTGDRAYGPVGAGATEQQRVVFGRYGAGNKPKWVGSVTCLYFSSATRFTTVRDIDFYSTGARCVSTQSTITDTTATNINVINCNFSMSSTNTGSDRNALVLYGSGNKVMGNTFDGIPTDAMWLAGNSYEVAYNTVKNVATDGRFAGDCLQFTQDSSNSWAHHNYLDHRTSAGKHCIVVNGGANILIEDNMMMHIENGIFASHVVYVDAATEATPNTTNAIIRRNYISGGDDGVWLAPTADGSIVESNIVLQNTPPTNAYGSGKGQGIYQTTGVSSTIRNNTFICNSRLSGYGIRVGNITAGKLVTITNNIVIGFLTGVYINEVQANSSRWVESNNVYFNNVLDMYRQPYAVNPYLIDPLLDENYVPQEYIANYLATTGATLDINGATFTGAIGAVQADRAAYYPLVATLYSTINGHG